MISSFIFAFIGQSMSQDIIILKNSSDTIKCRILNEGDTVLKYIDLSGDTNVLIRKKYSEIERYYYEKKKIENSNEEKNNIQDEYVNVIKPDPNVSSLPESKDYDKYTGKISANIGIGYWFIEIPSGVTWSNELEFYNDIKKGSSINLILSFKANEDIGIGLMYSSFFSKADFYDYPMYNFYGGVSYVTLHERIDISFIGPDLDFYIPLGQSVKFVLGTAPGLFLYTDECRVGSEKITAKGNCFGMAVSGSLEFRLAGNCGLSLKGLYLGGNLQKVKALDQYYDYEDRIGHININAGIFVRF